MTWITAIIARLRSPLPADFWPGGMSASDWQATKLDVKPGDTVLIRTTERLHDEALGVLHLAACHLQQRYPDVMFLVVNHNVDVTVLRHQEAA